MLFKIGQRLEITKHNNTALLTVESVSKDHIILHDDRDKTARFKYPKAFFIKCKDKFKVVK